MTDPSSNEIVDQRIAYLREVRALHGKKRQAGFVLCLIGALLVIWGSQRSDPHILATNAGVALIAAGWALFIYVIVMRTRYVRSHPFEPKR